jgi:hypothetical protein
MARSILLDKVLTAGVEAKTDEREALIIRAIGTDSTTDAYLEIEEKPTGKIKSIVAPMYLRDANLLGPMRLGDLFYVVPPATKVVFKGAPGSKCRIIGEKILLDPGERLGEPYISRYAKQTDEYKTFVEATFSKDTGVAWAADEENVVYSLTPSSIEKYVFDDVVMFSISNVSGGVSPGDFAWLVKIDNVPLENIVGTNIQRGFDLVAYPRPPTDTSEESPITLANMPIEIVGPHKLEFLVRNTSGSSKSPTTGNAISVVMTAIVKYYRIG